MAIFIALKKYAGGNSGTSCKINIKLVYESVIDWFKMVSQPGQLRLV